MKLTLCAVGRLRGGAERALVDDYMDRATRAGRALGLGPFSEIEVEDRKGGGKAGEAALLRKRVPPGFVLVVLDERGKLLSSPDFSRKLAGWRDHAAPGVAFVIGGADGVDAGLRAEADLVLGFGKMVWPHMLARVMLAEQIYRAVTILSGSPYHRS